MSDHYNSNDRKNSLDNSDEVREILKSLTDAMISMRLEIASQGEKIKAQTTATEGLVEAWAAAKGMSTLVKWIAGIATPIIAIYLTWKKSQ
jgi:hypothetical protein